MIPWDTFKTPQDAYEWGKKRLSAKDIYGRLKFDIWDREWSEQIYVVDQHCCVIATISKVRP